MSTDLEDRLRDHARSFDSLLSLIPAKLYYGEDVSDQWKRKKQTPEQKRAAKMAKLDPDNWKSAKDVMDERSAALKHKREEEDQFEDLRLDVEIDQELPKAVQDRDNHKAKRRKMETVGEVATDKHNLSIEEKQKRAAERKAQKTEKNTKRQEKLQRQKQRKEAAKVDSEQKPQTEKVSPSPNESMDLDEKIQEHADQWSTTSSGEDEQAIFSPPAESASSSISSLPLGPSDQRTNVKSRGAKEHSMANNISTPQIISSQPDTKSSQPQSQAEREAARARLAEAISSFRSARKADETTSNKPRNRAELLEQRRRKEETKKQAKKEQRRKEREEAARKEDEEIAKRFSPGGSGSLLASPRSPPSKDGDKGKNNFSYGRIEFIDGSNLDATNSESMQSQRKKKGPQDMQTALLAAQNKASRLAGLDEDKRKAIQEKDMWLNAKRRAYGERVRDDTSLLKKALKRQDSQKKKSEKEWDDRKSGVEKSQEARQKKRTDNLAKRKEAKMEKKVGKSGKKVKKRPGFEGSFKGRTGGGKRKS